MACACLIFRGKSMDGEPSRQRASASGAGCTSHGARRLTPALLQVRRPRTRLLEGSDNLEKVPPCARGTGPVQSFLRRSALHATLSVPPTRPRYVSRTIVMATLPLACPCSTYMSASGTWGKP
jgi:hypothetical protein